VINHGVWPADDVPVAKMTDEQWESTRRANLDAVIYVCRAAIPNIKEGGTIVAGVLDRGQRGEAFHADYAATKGAVISITKSLAVELAPKITINCVAPGGSIRKCHKSRWNGKRERGNGRSKRTIPLGRIASAEELPGRFSFLSSPLAATFTGEILNVNGGSVLCG